MTYLQILHNQIHATIDENDFLKEELIAKNLDISLKNGNMHKLPLKKLNRILNSPKRLINDHHLLFSFVISVMKTKLNEKLSQEDQENLFLLPSSLDYCEMSNDEISELFLTEKTFNFFEPRHSKEKIESFVSKEQLMVNKIDLLEKQIKEINDSFRTKITDYENHINETDTKIVEIQKTQKNSKINEKSFLSKIESIESNQNTYCGKLNDHDLKLSKNEKSIKELNEKLKEISEVKKQDEKVCIECGNCIFKYLFDKYKTNPSKNGMIKINGNSYDSLNDNKLPNIIDANWTSNYWCSKHVQNSYIKIDFTQILVRIDKYTLRVGNTLGDFYFTSWTLSGITENNQDVILDDVNNSNQINKSHPKATVILQGKPFVRSIQIKMKGNHNRTGNCDYGMAVRYFEIFGQIKFI